MACVPWWAIADPNLLHLFDDWVDDPGGPFLCRGYYQEPDYPFPGRPATIPGEPLAVTFDRGELVGKGTSEFHGNVVAKEGNRTVQAEHVWLHHDENEGDLEWLKGKDQVTITEPGLRIDGTEAMVDIDSDTKTIQNAHYRLYPRHARGYAKEMKAMESMRFDLKDATYTTCSPKDSVWYLRAQEVNLNKETGRGEAWHSRLYLRQIPVFYFPYLNFPIDDRRQTGFLIPSMGNSSVFGDNLLLPFYWNIAPNYDLTLYPHMSTKRGFKMGNEFRYLNSNYFGSFIFTILPHDRQYRHFRSQRLGNPGEVPKTDPRYTQLKSQEQTKRYLYSWKHAGHIGTHFTYLVDYTKVSDDNYLQDFAASSKLQLSEVSQGFGATGTNPFNQPIEASITTLVPQTVAANYFDHWGMAYVRMFKYQVLHPFDGPAVGEPYRKLPEAGLQTVQYGLPAGFYWQLTSDYTNWKMSMPQVGDRLTEGQRLHFRTAVGRPWVEPGWFFKPRVQFDALYYDLNLNHTDWISKKPSQVSRLVPIFDIDTGLIFERSITALKQPYIHTLEPRMYYLYVPKGDQTHLPLFDTSILPFSYDQLWRDNRYAGSDRVGDTHQVTLGLTSSFIDARTGEQKAFLAAGRIIYFRDRLVQAPEVIDNKVRLPVRYDKQGRQLNPTFVNTKRYSPYAALAQYFIDPYWNATMNVVWDASGGNIDTFGAHMQYQSRADHVFNVGYQFNRLNFLEVDKNGDPIPLSQMNTSLAWRLTPRWAALGRLDYDLQRSRVVNLLMGLEHQGCCTLIRLGWTRVLRSHDNLTMKKLYDHGWMLQFVFKGLNGVGNTSSDYFASKIPGFTPVDDRY